jgi:flagellar assembly protein FliH
LSDLPKSPQSAYQRWEMTSFGDERPSVVAARKPPPPPEPEIPPLEYPTEEELAAIREQARAVGHEEGRRAGHQEALALGQAEAAKQAVLTKAEAAKELTHLLALASQFGDALADADQMIANDVLDLALHLAKGMLKTALRVKPELVLPVVREAIAYLPVVAQPALLMLHPLDAEVVREGIGDELTAGGWRVIDDPHINRGGCRIETASNQINAEAESRWQRLTHALGKDLDWLAP